MSDNMKTKVVLKQTVLQGSRQPGYLQDVATVYIDGAAGSLQEESPSMIPCEERDQLVFEVTEASANLSRAAEYCKQVLALKVSAEIEKARQEESAARGHRKNAVSKLLAHYAVHYFNGD